MSIYKKLIQAIKTKLEVEFNVGKQNSLLKKVTIIAGNFNSVQDLLDFSKDAPCIGIGIKEFNSNYRNYGNQLESIAKLFLYLATNNKTETINEANLNFLDILEKVNLLLKNGKWNLDEVWQTENNSIVCKVYNAEEFYNKGIVLWEVNWKQKILLGESSWKRDLTQIDKATVNTDIQDNTKKETIVFKAKVK